MRQGKDGKGALLNRALLRRSGTLIWYDKFLHQKLRQARRIMPDDAVLLQQIVEHATHAERVQFFDIHAHGISSARAIPARHFPRYDLLAGYNPIE
jgi:hypothetical protein